MNTPQRPTHDQKNGDPRTDFAGRSRDRNVETGGPSLAFRIRRGTRGLAIFGAFLILLAACGRLVFFKGPILPPSPLPDSALIDMHCHVAGIGAGDSGCFISKSLEDSFRLGVYLKSFGVSREELRAQGDQCVFQKLSRALDESRHVGGAIVLALDGVVDANGDLDRERTEIYIPNDFVAAETAKYKNLYFGASVNPLRRDALDRLERVHRQGAKLIKWLPSIQSFDPADERIIPFYKKLIALRLPLLSHAGQERSFTRAEDELADPERLRLPLRLGVRVIVAHVAATGENEGELDYDRLVAMLDEFPNLRSEISTLTQINKIFYLPRVLHEKRFVDRLYYGSDYPLIATPLVSPWYFPLNLTIGEMFRLSRIKNPWDRDVELKQALGVPNWILTKSRELIDEPAGNSAAIE